MTGLLYRLTYERPGHGRVHQDFGTPQAAVAMMVVMRSAGRRPTLGPVAEFPGDLRRQRSAVSGGPSVIATAIYQKYGCNNPETCPWHKHLLIEEATT